jgi:hypothetical protein
MLVAILSISALSAVLSCFRLSSGKAKNASMRAKNAISLYESRINFFISTHRMRRIFNTPMASQYRTKVSRTGFICCITAYGDIAVFGLQHG